MPRKNKTENKFKEGDKCPECKEGRIALMSTIITYADKDQEPYKSGEICGKQEEVHLNDSIQIHIDACDKCGKIFRRWFDDTYLGCGEEIDNIKEAFALGIPKDIPEWIRKTERDNSKNWQKIDKLEKENESLKEENKKLNGNMKFYYPECTRLKNEIEELKLKLSVLEERKNTIRVLKGTELVRGECLNEEFKKRYNLKEDKTGLVIMDVVSTYTREDLDRLLSESLENKERIKTLKSLLMSKSHEDSSVDISKSKKEVHELKDEIKLLKHNEAISKQVKDSQKETIEILDGKVEKLTKEISELQKLMNAKQKDLNDLGLRKKQEIEELKRRITNITDSEQEVISNLQSEKRKLQEELKDIESKNHVYLKRLDTYVGYCQKYDADINNLKASRNKLLGLSESYSEDLKRARKELERRRLALQNGDARRLEVADAIERVIKRLENPKPILREKLIDVLNTLSIKLKLKYKTK